MRLGSVRPSPALVRLCLLALLFLAIAAAGCGSKKRAPSVGWLRSSDSLLSGIPKDQAMTGVIAAGPGFVAWGFDLSSDIGDGAIWTSDDGNGWNPVIGKASFSGPGNQTIAGMVAGGPGLIAVGSAGTEAQTTMQDDAAVWTSKEGLSWTRLPDDAATFGGGGQQGMSDITAGGPGFVAVGEDFSGGDADAAVWTSKDGFTWQRVAKDPAVFGGSGDQEMGKVVAGEFGLVATGFDDSAGTVDVAVWTSKDGLNWQRVPDDPLVFGGAGVQLMADLVAAGPGLVAVGLDSSSGKSVAAVWTSKDGSSWTRVLNDANVFGGFEDRQMTAVTRGGPGLVAVGCSGVFISCDGAVWTSKDGNSWKREAVDSAIFGGNGAQVPMGIAAKGSDLVAVGSDAATGDRDPAVWISKAG